MYLISKKTFFGHIRHISDIYRTSLIYALNMKLYWKTGLNEAKSDKMPDACGISKNLVPIMLLHNNCIKSSIKSTKE